MEVEVNNKYKQYELTINKQNQERDDLNRKLADLSTKLNEKIQMLNNLLTENDTLKKRIEKYDISITAYESEVNKRFSNMDQSISSLSR